MKRYNITPAVFRGRVSREIDSWNEKFENMAIMKKPTGALSCPEDVWHQDPQMKPHRKRDHHCLFVRERNGS